MTNYSEFGLIVAAIGVANGWIDAEWLVVIAIALSLSFVVAAPLNSIDDKIYSRCRDCWMRFERKERLPDDILLDISGATIAVFGMGRIGSGAYEKMRDLHGDTVIGIDFDSDLIKKHREMGHNVLYGDPSDADFWDKIEQNHSLELVMLALPNLRANLDALEQLRVISFSGRIAATARYRDEKEQLQQLGVQAVFDVYTEAGAGFAEHVEANNK